MTKNEKKKRKIYVHKTQHAQHGKLKTEKHKHELFSYVPNSKQKGLAW